MVQFFVLRLGSFHYCADSKKLGIGVMYNNIRLGTSKNTPGTIYNLVHNFLYVWVTLPLSNRVVIDSFKNILNESKFYSKLLYWCFFHQLLHYSESFICNRICNYTSLCGVTDSFNLTPSTSTVPICSRIWSVFPALRHNEIQRSLRCLKEQSLPTAF